MRRPALTAAALVIALVAAAGVAGIAPGAANGGARGDGGEIVFTAKVGAHTQLFTIGADGTGLKQLTDLGHGTDALNPSWSPNGKQIIFERDFPAEHAGVYRINSDGSGLVALTPRKTPKGYVYEAVPSYAPNGRKVVFTRQRCFTTTCTGPHDHVEAWTMSAKGTGRHRLTPYLADGKKGDRYIDYPAFSPNGKRVAFGKTTTGTAAIYVINANGKGLTRLTPAATQNDHPRWSPDGTEIAYTTDDQDTVRGKDPNIVVMHANGTKPTLLTHYTGGGPEAYMDSWSPDGTMIVFHLKGTQPDGSQVDQLYTMSADGTNLRQLTHMPAGSGPSEASWTGSR